MAAALSLPLPPPCIRTREHLCVCCAGVGGVVVLAAVRDVSDASVSSLQRRHRHLGRGVRVRAALRPGLGAAPGPVRPHDLHMTST